MAIAPTVVWSSTSPQTIYICQANFVTSGPITGVQSCGQLDLTYYDGENYRDDFTGSVYALATTGTNPSIQSGQTVPVAYPFSTPADLSTGGGGSPVYYPANLIIHTDGAGATAPASQAITSEDISMTDAAMHVPPRNEQKKQTLLTFFSGANCTGNVLYSLPEDQFKGYSLAPFTFVA